MFRATVLYGVKWNTPDPDPRPKALTYAAHMHIRLIDPRDTAWEQDHATFRVHFWDVPAKSSYEYEVLAEVDADELLAWAGEYATRRGWTYTVYVVVADASGPGLIRLAGVSGDPFANA